MIDGHYLKSHEITLGGIVRYHEFKYKSHGRKEYEGHPTPLVAR